MNRVRYTILSLTARHRSICPSEVARAVFSSESWHQHMDEVREEAWCLVDEGLVEVTQRDVPVRRGARGPIRIRRSLCSDGR